MEVIPTTKVENTNGTINILMALMNRSPSGLKTAARSPSSEPAITPSTSPVMICCHNGTRALKRAHRP